MAHNSWPSPPPSGAHYLSQTRTGYLDSFCQEGDARHVNPQAHAVNGNGASNYGLSADYGVSNYGAYPSQSTVNAYGTYDYWQNTTPQAQTYKTSHNAPEIRSSQNEFLGLDFGGPQTGTQEPSPENVDVGSSLFHLLNPLPQDGHPSHTLGLSPDVPTLPYLPMPCQVPSPTRGEESPLTPQCPLPSPPLAQMPHTLDNTWRSSPPPNPNFFDSEPEEDEDMQHDSALSALLLQQDDDTHLDRQGPNALCQPPTRTAAPKKLTAAQKATQQIKQAAQQEKREEMLLAADAMIKRHKQEVQQLAQSYGYTREYLEKLLKTSSHFKGTHRGPQLWNAKLHDKANELESSTC